MRVILVTYSEVALKKRNRRDFEQRLITNCKKVLGDEGYTIARTSGRIIITPDDELSIATYIEKLRCVCGIHSCVNAVCVDSMYESIEQAVITCVAQYCDRITTFGLRTKRTISQFQYSSSQMNIRLGETIQRIYRTLSVDLNKPDLWIHIEIRERGVYIYTNYDTYSGVGGLPTGSTGQGLGLLSGGIDSPVAMWFAMKRGLSMDAVYFHSAPYTGDKSKQKVVDIARELSRWNGGTIRLYVPSFSSIQKYIADTASEAYWTILFRRSMHRIVDHILSQNKYDVTVTGDSLAQVASQTPANCAVIDNASSAFTLRPLVGFDKQEIIKRARIINTYTISSRPYDDCCHLFTPSSPKTKTRLIDIERMEDVLNLEHFEVSSVKEMKVYDISRKEVVCVR